MKPPEIATFVYQVGVSMSPSLIFTFAENGVKPASTCRRRNRYAGAQRRLNPI